MPTSHMTDTLRAKHAAFFIAALITASLALETRSAEVTPQKPDRYFNDSAGVVSKKAAYRFNEELAQFEPLNSNRLKDRIDSSRHSAFVIAALNVRLDDRGPGETVPQQHRGGASAETPTTRTTVVSPVHQEEHEPAGPGQTSPVATATEKPVRDNHRVDPVPSPWFFIIFVVALIFVIALIIISRILRGGRPEESPRHPDKSYNPPSYPLRIAIKFNRRGGKPPQHLDGWQASLGGIAKQLAPLRLLPLFGSLNLKLLSELVDLARKNDPDYKPVDFSAWFEVETPAGVNADKLVKRLRKLPNIETAYVMVPSPPPVNPDDERNPEQHYQDAAPNGIDARYAWGFTGGDGAGIGFVDLEQGWNLDHEDLKDAKITIISGLNKECHSHGTSVLGEVLMVDNKKGGVGVAPSAKGRVISLWQTDAGASDDSLPTYKTAVAIADAATKMSEGDVLLIEVQERDPVGLTYDWPAEVVPANYEAIEAATKAGKVVVEAAGNGGHNLDAYKDASRKKIFDRSVRDSGAIMVGAASPKHPHTKRPKSNYGMRIDCYAWGENIDTATTSAAGTSNTMYTPNFTGTSGAAPIVAGAALIVQGIAQAAINRRERKSRFNPRELRDLLKTNGTKLKDGSTDTIGVMPDLRAIITNNKDELAPIPILAPGPP
jgi:subtilase family protein